MCCYLIEQVETIFGRRIDHSSKEEGRALLVKPTHMGPVIFILYFGMISSIGLSVVTFYTKALRLVAIITIFISMDIMTVHTNGNCLPLQGRILDAFVSKFGTLKHSIPQVLSSAIDISRLVPMRTNFSRQVGSSFIAVALYWAECSVFFYFMNACCMLFYGSGVDQGFPDKNNEVSV